MRKVGPMRRIGLTVGVLLLILLTCGMGTIGLRSMVPRSLVLVGASSLTTERKGATALSIRYEAGGAPFDWRGRLARQLEGQGWAGRSYTNMGARRPPFVTIWYTREHRFGPLIIVERAIFGGDAGHPTVAQIELRREVSFGNTVLIGRDWSCLLCWGES